MGARLCYNLLGTQEVISKLLRGVYSTKELRFYKGPAPDQEFWGQELVSIGGT